MPVPLSKLFDYRLDDDAVIGQRVLVEFGKSTQHVGLIAAIRAVGDDDDLDKLKPVTAVLDDFPVVDAHWRDLMLFAATYYREPLGKAYKNAFPKRLRTAEPLVLPRTTWYQLSDNGHQAIADDSVPKNAVKQRKLLNLLQQNHVVGKAMLKAGGLTTSDIKKAVEKTWVTPTHCSPYADDTAIVAADYPLNTEQQQVLDHVIPQLDAFHVQYLYGVTGSGKTEVYIHLITDILQRGQQVLLLVPEIALTPQMLSRFTQRFGNRVAAYHSGLSDTARRDVFLAAQAGELPILIGTRSAIFVPMPNVGLILIDEEHDLSYKQHEGFLYNARDLAVYRAKQLNINVVMGSATPSLESVANVGSGKYQLHRLRHRATNSKLPDMVMIDRRGESRESVISHHVIRAMRQVLQDGKQVLLFLNRRGFAPVMMCGGCEWRSHCPSCSVYQTAHTSSRQLCCHHCGHIQPLPLRCPDCQGSDLFFTGAGTQKLEAQLNEQFPKHRILRLDRDKQTTSKQLDEALTSIHQGEVDIILGTQLVVKGHHFPNVDMVCVVDADSGLFSSDFRAEEHLYQQLIQVAGRAGRESNAGKVYIQSAAPDHEIFHALMRHDYWAYAEKLLKERNEYELPPHMAMTLVKASALDQATVTAYLQAVKIALVEHSQTLETLGPIPLAVERVKNRYHAQLWLSATDKRTMQSNLPLLQQIIHHYDKPNRFRTIIDVDAM